MRIRTSKSLPLTVAALACVGLLGAACSDDSDSGSTATVVVGAAPTVAATGFTEGSSATFTAGDATAVADANGDDRPTVKIENGPFGTTETVVVTIVKGDGAEVTASDVVTFDYEGVNGSTGKTFDSSFEKGTPLTYAPSGLVPGFSKALIGQTIGSTVAVAVTPDDGYGPSGGTPDGSISATDTIFFVIKIRSVS